MGKSPNIWVFWIFVVYLPTNLMIKLEICKKMTLKKAQ